METKQIQIQQNQIKIYFKLSHVHNNFIHRVPRLQSQAIPVQLGKHICKRCDRYDLCGDQSYTSLLLNTIW